jgi:hypothetical protein
MENIVERSRNFSRARHPLVPRIHLKVVALGLLVAVQLLPNLVRADSTLAQPARALLASTEMKRKLTVFDSRSLVAANDFARKLYWISDVEVLFLGYEVAPGASPGNDRELIDYRVSIWNVRTNTIRILQDFGSDYPSTCFSDGHVLLRARSTDGVLRTYYGDTSAVKLAAPDQEFHDLFCRPLDKVHPLPTWTQGRDIRWLQKIDAGFVDFGEISKSMKNAPLRLYKHGAREKDGILLPLGSREVWKSFPYFAFKGAFFVESTYRRLPRPKGVPYPLYWLYQDGRLEQILDLPWGPWRSNASSWPMPTKAGIMIASHNANVRNAKDLAHAGLYLVGDGKVTRLLTAWIQATAVSPNGCRVAFDFANEMTEMRNTLKAIDVCAERAR